MTTLRPLKWSSNPISGATSTVNCLPLFDLFIVNGCLYINDHLYARYKTTAEAQQIAETLVRDFIISHTEQVE